MLVLASVPVETHRCRSVRKRRAAEPDDRGWIPGPGGRLRDGSRKLKCPCVDTSVYTKGTQVCEIIQDTSATACLVARCSVIS